MSAFLLLQASKRCRCASSANVANGRAVANAERDPRVAWVDYAGLPTAPISRSLRKYLGGRAASLPDVRVGAGSSGRNASTKR